MKIDQRPSFEIARQIQNGVFAEVGTWEGDFSYDLLKYTTCQKLFCVDPYKHFTEGEYPDGMNRLTQAEFDTKFLTVNQRFHEFGPRAEFVRMESVQASTYFPENFFDFVYIDGNHDYEYVKQDIRSWWPKVKVGGWLCGDDVYSHNLEEHDKDGNVLRVWATDSRGAPTCWGKYGSYKAVKDLEAEYQYTPIFQETQFLIQKK